MNASELNGSKIKNLTRMMSILVENSMIEQGLLQNFFQNDDVLEFLFQKLHTRIRADLPDLSVQSPAP
jgi:hypothetical protein